jgi:uncharacterized membrane protein YqaE (UPF0057 family)
MGSDEREEAYSLDGYLTDSAGDHPSPLGVFLQVGPTKHFWINILLTILGYVPGLVHAVWVIATFSRKEWSSS